MPRQKIKKLQPVTTAVALMYFFIVFQEGAVLQDVGGV
jgi:hypothetical protein